MAWKSAVVTTTTTGPGVLVASSTIAANSSYMSLAGASITDTVPIVISNRSSTVVYFGGATMLSSVSTSLGTPISSGTGSVTINAMASDPIYILSVTDAVSVTVQAGRQTASA